MSPPAVSVVIPTYNRAALLPRALTSVIEQTFTDWEIVLVDDGSTDETEAVAAHYAGQLGERFTYLRQKNKGSSRARNAGIDLCRGRFVAFLDSDDEYRPTKLQRQIELFETRPELGLVYSDWAFVDLEGVRHQSALDTKCPLARHVPVETVGPGLHVCAEPLFDWLIRAYFIATIVGLVRREVLGGEIRFPESQAYAEEWLFYLRVARRCRAGFVDEPLSLHHFVPGSLARTDKHRNTVRYHALLKAIRDEFDGLSRESRSAIRGQLARTCRQLGYDALRDGDGRRALLCFAESLWHEPNSTTAGQVLRAGVSCIRRRGGRPLDDPQASKALPGPAR